MLPLYYKLTYINVKSGFNVKKMVIPFKILETKIGLGNLVK